MLRPSAARYFSSASPAIFSCSWVSPAPETGRRAVGRRRAVGGRMLAGDPVGGLAGGAATGLGLGVAVLAGGRVEVAPVGVEHAGRTASPAVARGALAGGRDGVVGCPRAVGVGPVAARRGGRGQPAVAGGARAAARVVAGGPVAVLAGAVADRRGVVGIAGSPVGPGQPRRCGPGARLGRAVAARRWLGRRWLGRRCVVARCLVPRWLGRRRLDGWRLGGAAAARCGTSLPRRSRV